MHYISTIKEFWDFLKHRKKLFLFPVILVLLLLAALLFLAESSVVAPFIYTLF